MTLKIQKIESTGVVYSDPIKTSLVARVKHGRAVKNISGTPVTNHTTEVIFNDDNIITVGDKELVDAVSVRIRVSGSAQSMARAKKLIDAFAGVKDSWATESVFVGFNPETAPVVAA